MSLETRKEDTGRILARWQRANHGPKAQARLIANPEKLWRLARDLAFALENQLAHARGIDSGSTPLARPIPRVPAYPDDRGGLRMWCAWCDRWHFHSPGYGHRNANCHKGNSPYRNTGYALTDPAAMEPRR